LNVGVKKMPENNFFQKDNLVLELRLWQSNLVGPYIATKMEKLLSMELK